MNKIRLSIGLFLILFFVSFSGCLENQTSETENKYPLAVIGLDAVLPILPGDEFYLSANSSSDQDGDITEYIWEFPDGSTSKSRFFRYEYDDVGSYEISLLVIDNGELTNKTTKTVDVVPIPIINLSFSEININESDGSILFNISVIKTQYHSVKISDIATDAYTLYEDNLTSSGGYASGLEGDYFDVDSDEYVSVGDYVQYLYNHDTTTIGPGGVELSAYSFTYGLYYYTHKPLMPLLGEVIY